METDDGAAASAAAAAGAAAAAAAAGAAGGAQDAAALGGGAAGSEMQEANSVRPAAFKALVGKGHPEFSSGRQQVRTLDCSQLALLFWDEFSGRCLQRANITRIVVLHRTLLLHFNAAVS
jgi:hypothetical protein